MTAIGYGMAVAGVAAGIVAAGNYRWRAGTHQLREKLDAGRTRGLAPGYDKSEIHELPAPVRRYLDTALAGRRELVQAVHLEHRGEFNTGTSWCPFTSTQRVVTRRPGFDWDARIEMGPGISTYVHDAYVGGEGILKASVLGLLTVAEIRGTPQVAEGELMRYLAEAVWYPTALLPSQGTVWTAIDATSAAASLKDGATSVALEFRFDPNSGLPIGVYSASRTRTVKSGAVPTPWEGHFWNYRDHAGIVAPIEGEVGWWIDGKLEPYWRGRVTRIEYEP